MRTQDGKLSICLPDGEEIYRGKPDADLVAEHFKDEHELIRYALHNTLMRAGVFGSGWFFVPMNSKQIIPKVIPTGSGSLRL